MNFEELERLQERARQGPLGEEDCQRLQATIQALSYLIELIGEKDTTISRLRALLAKPSTEKTSKVFRTGGVGSSSEKHSLAFSRELAGETGTRSKRGGGVSRSPPQQDRAHRVEARGSLSTLLEG